MTAMQTRSRTRSVVVLVVVVALVLGVVGVLVAVSTRGNDPSPPSADTSPVLDLSRTTNVSGADAAAAGDTASGGSYVLDGTLATTQQEGVVIDPSTSSATEAQVRALVAALGMRSVTVQQVAGAGWTATGRAAGQQARFALDETAGNVWQYGRGPLASCLAVNPGAAPDTASSCAKVTSPDAHTAIKGPGRAALITDAAQVFALVGVTPGTGLLAHDDNEGATYLSLPLTVEGLPVVDVTLSVGADKDGLVSASGSLDPTFTTVGQYPLISARAAFVQLAATPVPEPAIACAATASCPAPAARKVTAARLAWLTTQNGGGLVLVPAWQFEVDGFYGPAVVAVAPAYLGGPTAEPTTEPTTGSGGASSEPGVPGSAAPAPPNTVRPPRDR